MRSQIHRVIAILGVFLAFAGASVQAQTSSRVEVNIPFGFSAGKETLKLGVYTIKRVSGNLLAIQNVEDKSAAMLNAPVTLSSTDPESLERLVFNKDGDQYSLAEIWLTADSGREVSRLKKYERVKIALSRKR